jgi:glycosyltransferase involved in cell wall biosynthesis
MTDPAAGPLVVHVTTTDISLALLLGPQLRAFKQAGWRVVGASAAGPYVAQLQESGIDHVALRYATRAVAPGKDVLALVELVRLFRRLRPDVVHTHNPKPGIYGRFAARIAGVPAVVNTVHGIYATPEDRLRRRALVYTAELLASLCSDAELVQNPEDAAVLLRLGVPQRKVAVLGNGIDLSRFDPARTGAADREAVRRELGARDDDVVVGVVGRLVWEKGYREVFEAVRLLRSEAPAVRVVCAGPEEPDKADGVDRESLEEAKRNGAQWLGARSDVERLYAAFDMYVLASYREGFPRSAMEAAAMGLPIVATDIRGCRQVVDHGLTGLLVPPRDSTALADAIAALAGDPSRRAAMGAAGRAKALVDFDQGPVIAKTLATYARLTSR